LMLAVFVTTTAAVMAIRKQSKANMAHYRAEELRKTRENLENLVDTAYSVIESNHKQAQDREYLERVYSPRLKDILGIAESIIEEFVAEAKAGRLTETEAKKKAAEAIRRIRYDNGKGYVWINDTGKPIPKMIMHPFCPELEGKVLDDPKYNCVRGTNANLFQTFVDQCEIAGEGFVEYRWPKPLPGGSGLTPNVPKLAYARSNKHWRWILGTGVYVDDVLVDAAAKSKDQIRNMRYDHGTGYFWINDTGKPIPRMIMHPLFPELEGKVLDDPKYNCARGTNTNLFRAFVDQCEIGGRGFVDYRWPKPTVSGLTDPAPKLSYGKRYEPLGWIVGTGVYVDGIDAAISKQTDEMKTQVNNLVQKVVLFSAATFLFVIAASIVSAKSVAGPIVGLIETMKNIRAKGLSTKRVQPGGASELKELGSIFNTMLDAIDAAVAELIQETAAKERMQHDLAIARSIQQGLLPTRSPEIKGFEIAGWSQPADETGGDYFDWQPLPDGRLAISLADVTGHGIGPALVTAVCRAYARASFPSSDNIGLLLDRMNDLLVEDLPDGRFVTFVVAIVDPKTASAEVLSAGHGPLLVFTRKDRGVRAFKAHGIPFGVMPDVDYGVPDRIELAPGDILVLITDGFFEWANADGELFGIPRLEETIREVSDQSPDRIISELYSRVKEFAGGTKQDDDLTVVVIKRNGESLSV
jgi:serine phosphatase RsbU (regulator of sigma subunit)/signal transduction histidine kinase